MAAPATNTILFLVGDREPPRYGLTWRIWSRGTSFYIKTREPGLAQSKVSLHGPDPRHPRPGFKFGLDSSASGADAAAVNLGNPLPWWFPGKVEVNDLIHVIRICVPAGTLARGRPNGADPGNPRTRTFACLLEAPPEGSSALLDLYLSSGPPDFPIRARLERQKALIGPIVNSAGQHLSGVTRIIASDRLDLSHLAADVPEPASPSDAVRGVQIAGDGEGVLWLVERVLSRTWLTTEGTQSGG
jgi:hypothetical protein